MRLKQTKQKIISVYDISDYRLTQLLKQGWLIVSQIYLEHCRVISIVLEKND